MEFNSGFKGLIFKISTWCSHCVYVFSTISQQTASNAFYNLSRLVLYNRGWECLLRGTHWVLIQNSHV